MLRGLAILFLCQLVGESLVQLFHLAVPAPAIGLLLLTLGLLMTARLTGQSTATVDIAGLGQTTSFLLANLGVLFVPASVGIIQNLPLVATHGFAIIASIFVSTLLALVATVGTFLAVKSLTHGQRP